MTTSKGHNVEAALQHYVERIERLRAEKREQAQDFTDAIKEVFAEAKGEGFDAAAIREVIRLRAMSREKRETLDLYAQRLGVFG